MSDSMNKITFTLKQHTPLIHFQFKQKGATLRASEVKPRLDRFLIQKFGGWDKIPNEWKIDNPNGNALKYKLSIITNKIPTIIPEGKPLYFGNTGKEVYEYKELVIYDELNLIFLSNSSLIIDEKFHDLIKQFFEKNNFGSREKKGFGSFTVLPEYPEIHERLSEMYKFSFDVYNVSNATELKKVYEYIDIFSKLIKSGYNVNGLYLKPFSFLYAKSKNWQWDKKSIKEKFLPNHFKYAEGPTAFTSNTSFSGNKPFIRGVLGLGPTQKIAGWELSIKDKDEQIERYSSPLFFKPVFYNRTTVRVYFDWIDKSPGIWSKTFTHSFGNHSEQLYLTVPARNEFNPENFMKFIVKSNPRDYVVFRLELRYFERQLGFNNLLSDQDKLILNTWRQTIRGRYLVIKNLSSKNVGTQGYSIFKLLESELAIFNFNEPKKVEAFFDGLNPTHTMQIIDNIFTQLNAKCQNI